MKKVISVRFKENGKSYYFDPAGADIKTGEYVVVELSLIHISPEMHYNSYLPQQRRSQRSAVHALR